MTIQQRAEQVASMPQFEVLTHGGRRKLETLIRQAINAAVALAVEEEREGCAKIVENADAEPYCGFHIAQLARQIRARSIASHSTTPAEK